MSIYPTRVATDADLHIAVNNLGTLLNGALTAIGDNTGGNGIAVVSTTGFPTVGSISIDEEIIFYTGKAVFTGLPVFTGITRGQDGTTAAIHPNGENVDLFVIAAHHNFLKDEVEAIEQDLSDRIGLNLSVITPPVGGISLQDTEGTPKTITIKAPTTITSSYTVKFPDTQGGSNTFLHNDGSGTLTWATAVTSGVTDIHADGNPALTGSVHLVSGTNVSLVQVGQNITINSTASPTTGDLTDVGTDGIVITGGTGAVIGSGTSIAQHVADTTHNGYLDSPDWNQFNNGSSPLEPPGNVTIAPLYGVVHPQHFTIAMGFTLTLGLNAVFAII